MSKQRILTALTVEKAKARPGRRYDLPDGPGGIPGLALRVSERGVKTYSLRYRVNGRMGRVTLGQHPVLSLGDARTKAREALVLVEKGVDPAATARAAKAASDAEADRDSIEAVIEQYAARYLRQNTKRPRDAEQMLRRELREYLDKPLKTITTRDMLDLVDGIADRGSPVSANRALDLIKRFLDWAVGRRIVETNVAAGLKHVHKEKPRERSLSEAEIKALWPAFEQQGWPFGDLGKLLLLTGQRRGEIAGLRWTDLNLETGVLRLSGTATKTGVEHVLPLSGAAVEILRDLPRIGDSPLVFPANKAGSGNSVSGFNRALTRAHGLSSTSGWHWHDIRRSCATHMARIGVAPHVVERILNHSGGSTMSVIARTYNTYTYQAEMRRAAKAWAAELDRIVAGEPAEAWWAAELGRIVAGEPATDNLGNVIAFNGPQMTKVVALRR